MDPLFLIFSFLFGAIIGSFLNVVIFRYHTGLGFFGRSMCLYCGKTLRFYEMIPIISFLFLKGRCASCKSRISIQYPLVEFSTALFFAAAFYHSSVSYAGEALLLYTLYLFVAVSLLIIIAAYDLKHTVIPDGLVFLFGTIAFLRIVFFPVESETFPMALMVGVLFALPLFLFYFLSGGRWMGLGDGKLALGLGWLLGAGASTTALLFSFWIGAVFALILLCLPEKRFTIKSEIPFGPFLAAGTFVGLLLPPGYFLSLFFL